MTEFYYPSTIINRIAGLILSYIIGLCVGLYYRFKTKKESKEKMGLEK